jgi:hypothetical protein
VVQKYSKLVFSYPPEKIWNQKGVSLKQRIGKDKKIKARVDKALQPENIAKYIVPADDTAPTRCIDGRILDGWESQPALQKRNLGPKIAGGTVHAALTHRIVDAEHLRENLRFEEDIKTVINRFKDIGIGFGGHIDNHQTGSNTGCGAVDNINLILDRLQSPTHQEQLRELTHLILGDAYDARYVTNEVIGRMLYLDALKPRYMPKENDDPNGEFLYKKTVVKTIREQSAQSEESVPALVGPHNEVALVLNFMPHTTVDTDRFSHDNNNEIQLFAWDIWLMYDEAQRLYPYDMHNSAEEQRSALEKRMKYLTTRTLLGVSTLMVLSDGTLRLVAVTPA